VEEQEKMAVMLSENASAVKPPKLIAETAKSKGGEK